MHAYLNVLRNVYNNGEQHTDRTGTGTRRLFHQTMQFDLEEGFPAVTTKKLAFKTMTTELLWFLQGRTDVDWLKKRNCKIWDEWQHEDGTIGPMYGYQWRNFGGLELDQFSKLIRSIRKDPGSRRHLLTTYNPADADKGVLYPCHGLVVQFHVDSKQRLHCTMYQRSGDLFLGVPFNIASYALLTHIVAEICDLNVGTLHITIGDAHIYDNHLEQVAEQLTREPKDLPDLWINPNIIPYLKQGKLVRADAIDFDLVNYEHHPPLIGKVSV